MKRAGKAVAGGLVAGAAFGVGVAGAHLQQGDTYAYWVSGDNSECAAGRSGINDSAYSTVAETRGDTFSTGVAYCLTPIYRSTNRINAAPDLYVHATASWCRSASLAGNGSTDWQVNSVQYLVASCGATNYKTRTQHAVILSPGNIKQGTTVSPDPGHYFG